MTPVEWKEEIEWIDGERAFFWRKQIDERQVKMAVWSAHCLPGLLQCWWHRKIGHRQWFQGESSASEHKNGKKTHQ